MPQLCAAHVSASLVPRKKCHTVRAVRPALTDLRFKGDPCVVDNRDGTVSVCLGDYQLVRIFASPFDVASLNSTLAQVRLGQARRLHEQRRVAAQA